MIQSWSRRKKIATTLFLAVLLGYIFCLPRSLFDSPRSFILESADGQLLGARIATDGQWRFPEIDSVPDKFATALIAFEDKRFYKHRGVDLRALARAMRQNIRAKRVVSGGSTLSMQLMRLSRKNPPRNLWQKAIESILATRLEWSYSKDEILALYASHAPFGGNVVGLEAASWRYYGKSPALLSWAEATTLAVLPNSPGLIHPGRNRQALLEKRNRLLDKLLEAGKIAALDNQLAKEEPLPQAPLPLPALAPHLLERARIEYGSRRSRMRSTLDLSLQRKLNTLAAHQLPVIRNNDVNNLAILVLHIPSRQVLAYVGNAPGTGAANHESVDIIKAPRSTGSVLKPLLFARMLEEGNIISNSLIPDIPTYINGYKPENYNLQYSGAIQASRALTRSLNVPFVRMLQDYGLEKFHFDLNKMGLNRLNPNPDHYGLTLILGGAEASLWEMCSIYAGMADILSEYYPLEGKYDQNCFRKATYDSNQAIPEQKLRDQAFLLGAGSIWRTFEAMQELERPDSEGGWRSFSSSRQIAWKTGTSFGYRDAWAIGLNPEYVVGVWVGNADGEGRPGLVGVKAAAPILFQAFDLLPASTWFEEPYDALPPYTFCAKSGFRAGPWCPTDTLHMPRGASKVESCKWHIPVQLDQHSRKRVNAACSKINERIDSTWFVLPPVIEHYYTDYHPEYDPLPAWKAGCSDPEEKAPIQLIYPVPNAQIYVPVNLDGSRSATVFKAAHRKPDTEIFWHLDDVYLGSTKTFHEIELDPEAGRHTLTLVDEKGFQIREIFEIVPKRNK